MRFTKFILAIQIELIWGKIHILRKRHSPSEKTESKIRDRKSVV